MDAAWLRHTCGRCQPCLRGAENLCPDSRYTGWDADGGYAGYAVPRPPARTPCRTGTVTATRRRCHARTSSDTRRRPERWRT
ncbi:alcohol dehydrogenase catalytic domain-containing protein [Nocardiopsis sp. NPDC006139]|uniref:alcohol dehydrogenase catalytic domain-containing protein n=1 Tax=Nocardiopsis sp. NPDC006139 TaxID=3154578 RepID=UPI0033AAA591